MPPPAHMELYCFIKTIFTHLFWSKVVEFMEVVEVVEVTQADKVTKALWLHSVV